MTVMKKCFSVIMLGLLISLAACSASRAQIFSDNFETDTTFNTSLWTSVKGDPIIFTHRLLLQSTPGNGCDATSIPTFLYREVKIQTPSYAWSEDTSIGFETWSPSHCGVVVTNGCLGIINHQIAGTISDQESYIPIPNWSTLWTGDNTYLIQWTSGTVNLYINGVFSCSYSGPKVPSVYANVRMNSSNDHYDNLQVAYCDVY